MESLIISLLAGAIVGWLADIFVKGYSAGLIHNMMIGIAGGLLGSFVLTKLQLTMGEGLFGGAMTAAIGAVILLWLAGVIQKNAA